MADSRCGLHCTGCAFKESHGCGGCIETNGIPFHGKCPVAICCQEKGRVHCGQCENIPCELLTQYSCDPVHGDHPQGARIAQCRRWKRKNTQGRPFDKIFLLYPYAAWNGGKKRPDGLFSDLYLSA